MDGYAVRAEDVPAAPTTLTLVGEAPAGGSYDHALKPGEAVRIFTGGPLPMGANSIVIQEDTKADGKKITILEAPTIGRHIRKAGLDFSAGDTPFPAGHTLTTRDVALPAAMNLPWLSVSPQAARGDPVDRRRAGDAGRAGRPQPDRLLLRHRRGGPGARLGRRSDPVRHRARRAAADPGPRSLAGAQHDMLITLGGASVGDHDLVQDALKAQGFAMDFWKIAMRPGKPLMFAAKDRARVLGLPGNPVSTMVCSLLFLKPAMERMTGPGRRPAGHRPARLAVDVKAERPARGLRPLRWPRARPTARWRSSRTRSRTARCCRCWRGAMR